MPQPQIDIKAGYIFPLIDFDIFSGSQVTAKIQIDFQLHSIAQDRRWRLWNDTTTGCLSDW